MKHVAQNSFENDDPGNDDIDEIFSRLDQLNPPTDLVQRVLQTVFRLPLLHMLPSSDERTGSAKE